MLDALVEVAMRKADGIRRIFSSLDVQTEKMEDLWIGYEPVPTRRTIAGVDSGWNDIRFRGFYLYAVDAAFAILGDGLDVKINSAEVDIITPEGSGSWSIGKELWLKGNDMEVGAARRAIEDAEVVLIDGSLLAKLVDATHWAKREEDRFLKFRRRLEELSHGLERRIAFISKDTESRLLLDGRLGDVHYVDAFSDEPGYTRPLVKDTRKTGMSELLKDVTVFYVRLERGAPALRVDVPGRAGEDDIERIIDVLHPISVRGYPYPLVVAHENAVVTSGAMESLASIIGIDANTRAREVLRL